MAQRARTDPTLAGMQRTFVIQRTLRRQSQQTPLLRTAATHADGAQRRHTSLSRIPRSPRAMISAALASREKPVNHSPGMSGQLVTRRRGCSLPHRAIELMPNELHEMDVLVSQPSSRPTLLRKPPALDRPTEACRVPPRR